jgi:triosephosphate isomerase
MRRPLFAANWKMNKTLDDCQSFMEVFAPLVWNEKDADIVIAPPFTALHTMANLLEITDIKLAAQNMFYEDKGAYTGEISPAMLTDAGCEYVIIGHSERRTLFGETDSTVTENSGRPQFRSGSALLHRRNPCGKGSGKTLEVLQRQLQDGLRTCRMKA